MPLPVIFAIISAEHIDINQGKGAKRWARTGAYRTGDYWAGTYSHIL